MPRPCHYRRFVPALAAAVFMLACGTAMAARHAKPKEPAKSAPSNQFVDGIAAVVNKDVITFGQLAQRTQQAEKQLAQQKITPPDPQTLRRQVLNRMIDDLLEEQDAKRLGIKVTDEQLQAAIKSVADRNKISVDKLRTAVGQTGISWDDYKKQLRQEVMLDELRHRSVDSNIRISDADIDAFLKTREGSASLFSGAAQPQGPAPAQAPTQAPARAARQASGPVMLGLAQILVAVPDNALSSRVAELRQKAESILAKLRSGANFATVAAASSDGPQAMQGGDLGVKPVDGWPDLFVSATSKLQVGQITGILKSGNGFHILKVLSRSGSSGQPAPNPPPAAAPVTGAPPGAPSEEGPKMVTQVHVRHILIKVTKVMSDEQARQRLLDLRQRIENGANFATLAQKYSEDASAPQGGDIGWISPGETVPDFEKAVDALQVGQVSEPVRTQFGWHLIQVLGRRTKNMEEEYRRNQARRILFERRAGPAFEEWLSQLRGKAYIDNRLDPSASQKGD
jgi:peptidyl-prolyl cis-trans isomerase SurA